VLAKKGTLTKEKEFACNTKGVPVLYQRIEGRREAGDKKEE